MMILLATILLLLLITTTSAADCGSELSCSNGATCQTTAADFSGHPMINNNVMPFHEQTTSNDGYSCDCPDGYTGLDCSVPYVVCDNADYICYHGGKCIPSLLTSFMKTELFYCDCTDTNAVGKYCEITQGTTCPGDKNVPFCANRGECPNEDSFFCDCSFPFVGAQCEYLLGTVPECGLPCLNDSICRLGQNNDDNLSYCQCPVLDDDAYFTGSRCEVRAVPCGDDGQCLNGGTCVETATGVTGCDCTTANFNRRAWAGTSCEFPATSECDNGEFCVNRGLCVQDSSCLCLGNFFGPQCQYEQEQSCKTNCECRKGAKDNSFLERFGGLANKIPRYNDDFEHCVCPPGLLGAECDVKYQLCQGETHICLNSGQCVCSGNDCRCECLGDFAGEFCEEFSPNDNSGGGVGGFTVGEVMGDAIECGDDFCLNGSECVEIVDENGVSSFHCDCTTAAIPNALEFFAGEHCQFQGNLVCGGATASPNGVIFCANRGLCPPDEDTMSMIPNDQCLCTNPQFEGPKCEFFANRDDDVCQLECQNGGECRKGAKDVTFLKSFGITSSSVVDQRYGEHSFEHCVCPLGYVGVSCEVPYDICNGGSHICLNGGVCACNSGTGKSQSCCDCPAGYRGDYCELETTTTDDDDDNDTVTGSGGGGTTTRNMRRNMNRMNMNGRRRNMNMMNMNKKRRRRNRRNRNTSA